MKLQGLEREAFIQVAATPVLLGVYEIAERLGEPREYVSKLHQRGKLPEPVATLQMGPVWTEAQVAAWAATRPAKRPWRRKAAEMA